MTTAFPEKPVTLKDGRPVVIRDATPDDAAAVLAFMRGMMPESRRCVIPIVEEFNITVEEEAAFIRQRTDHGGVLLLAESSGQIVGTSGCEPAARKRLAHVGGLGISLRQAWWSVGLGEAMQRWMIQWAEAHPTMTKLSLAVFADNERAIRLYRRCGFVEEGRLIKQTQREPGEFVDDVLMYRWVDKMCRCNTAKEPDHDRA